MWTTTDNVSRQFLRFLRDHTMFLFFSASIDLNKHLYGITIRQPIQRRGFFLWIKRLDYDILYAR